VVIKLSQIILCERSSLSLPNACLAASADKPNHVATASIKKPIHNVKEARKRAPYHQPKLANRYSSSLEN
jgi:hypothetical protein